MILVPTLRVGTACSSRSAARARASRRSRDAERRKKYVPTRSVGTRKCDRDLRKGGPMRRSMCLSAAIALVFSLSAPAAQPGHRVDELLARENAGRKVQEAPIVDDLAFLRRVSVDLIGRIPTDDEIQRYLALPAGERRTRTIDDLLKRDQFADRWTVFFGDMLRIRSNTEGGAAFLAFVHRA